MILYTFINQHYLRPTSILFCIIHPICLISVVQHDLTLSPPVSTASNYRLLCLLLLNCLRNIHRTTEHNYLSYASYAGWSLLYIHLTVIIISILQTRIVCVYLLRLNCLLMSSTITSKKRKGKTSKRVNHVFRLAPVTARTHCIKKREPLLCISFAVASKNIGNR